MHLRHPEFRDYTNQIRAVKPACAPPHPAASGLTVRIMICSLATKRDGAYFHIPLVGMRKYVNLPTRILKALWHVRATGHFMISRGIGMLDSRFSQMFAGQTLVKPGHGKFVFCLNKRISPFLTGQEGLDRHFGMFRSKKQENSQLANQPENGPLACYFQE